MISAAPAEAFNPSSEPFFASKTMILLVITMGFIFALVIVGIAVKIIWGEDVFNMVSSGIGGLVGQSAQGTVRNTIVDGAARASYAQATLPPAAPVIPSPPSH